MQLLSSERTTGRDRLSTVHIRRNLTLSVSSSMWKRVAITSRDVPYTRMKYRNRNMSKELKPNSESSGRRRRTHHTSTAIWGEQKKCIRNRRSVHFLPLAVSPSRHVATSSMCGTSYCAAADAILTRALGQYTYLFSGGIAAGAFVQIRPEKREARVRRPPNSPSPTNW